MQNLKKESLTKQLGWLLDNLLSPVKRLTERLAPSRTFLTMIALVVLSLLVLSMLSGCATASRSVPPQLDPRPMPPFNGQTYRDALIHIPELREWGMSCEADKAASRKALTDD